jgi:hypothetical protein
MSKGPILFALVLAASPCLGVETLVDDDFSSNSQGTWVRVGSTANGGTVNFSGGDAAITLDSANGQPHAVYQSFPTVTLAEDGDSLQLTADVKVSYTSAMVNFINARAAVNGDFFILCAFNAPHTPLHGKPEDMRALFPAIFGSWTDQQIRDNGAAWQGSIYKSEHLMAMMHAVDRAIGQVISTLQAHGLYDDTLIILTSDISVSTNGH